MIGKRSIRRTRMKETKRYLKMRTVLQRIHIHVVRINSNLLNFKTLRVRMYVLLIVLDDWRIWQHPSEPRFSSPTSSGIPSLATLPRCKNNRADHSKHFALSTDTNQFGLCLFTQFHSCTMQKPRNVLLARFGDGWVCVCVCLCFSDIPAG